MDKVSVALRVFFEDPFWIGVVERTVNGKLAVCKVTFGAEPRDCEVYSFLLRNYYNLRFSPDVETSVKKTCANPKRRQREAHRLMGAAGIGTKSQQALGLQREQMKTERGRADREQTEETKQRRLELKRQKKKEKHRGR